MANPVLLMIDANPVREDANTIAGKTPNHWNPGVVACVKHPHTREMFQGLTETRALAEILFKTPQYINACCLHHAITRCGCPRGDVNMLDDESFLFFTRTCLFFCRDSQAAKIRQHKQRA